MQDDQNTGTDHILTKQDLDFLKAWINFHRDFSDLDVKAKQMVVDMFEDMKATAVDENAAAA